MYTNLFRKDLWFKQVILTISFLFKSDMLKEHQICSYVVFLLLILHVYSVPYFGQHFNNIDLHAVLYCISQQKVFLCCSYIPLAEVGLFCTSWKNHYQKQTNLILDFALSPCRVLLMVEYVKIWNHLSWTVLVCSLPFNK